MSKEQIIRDAARTLHNAIVDGRKEGLVVAWPSRADDLPRIAISETAKVATHIGEVIGRPRTAIQDGAELHGEPLNLSDEERAALPKLEPLTGDEPSIAGTAKPSRSK